VVFDGGFGDGHAKRFEKLHADRHPKAEVSHTATQDVTGLLQPRRNAGNPPDVVDDSGNQQIKPDILRRAGQLADPRRPRRAVRGLGHGRSGYACATGVVILLLTLILAAVTLRVARRERIEF
jgi:hypothetical protein